MKELINAIELLLNSTAKEGHSENDRQMTILKSTGYTSQQSFFKDFYDAIVKKTPASKEIKSTDVIGLINLFGTALVRNFHTDADKMALFGRVPESQKSDIKNIERYDLPALEAVDDWGIPVHEVTMSANVAPPQLVTPIGMVRSGGDVKLMTKKKKRS